MCDLPVRGEGLPALPPEAAARGIALRPERQQDDPPFLERLYISVRWEEMAASGWPEEVRLAFLRSQFAMQTHHYRTHYHAAVFAIILCEGEPAGRLYLFRGPRDHRIVDISLLPEARGAGIGTLLLGAVQDEAGALGRTVSIHVEHFNPAQALYRRLGFVRISEHGPYHLMQWRANEPETMSPS